MYTDSVSMREITLKFGVEKQTVVRQWRDVDNTSQKSNKLIICR